VEADAAQRDDARAAFARDGYALLRGLIEPPLAAFLWSYVHTLLGSQRLSLGDPLTPTTPSAYGDPAFDGLLEYLRPRIEAATALRLAPTYSHVRLYKRGDGFRKHRDRAACEISVSLNLGQAPAEPWPLMVEGAAGPVAARLQPGDALLYRGPKIAHWREPYEGAELGQVFLHYVDRDGPNAHLKFDGRPRLMTPASTKVKPGAPS
jgi:hypothetical protein